MLTGEKKKIVFVTWSFSLKSILREFSESQLWKKSAAKDNK